MQEFEIRFSVRKQLWSFVPLDAVMREMAGAWPVSRPPLSNGWSEHRYLISQQGGDEVGLTFILSRQEPLAEQEAAATLQRLEALVQEQFPAGTRLWRTAESVS
jgi:hypothetical protein